jgi:hypothetical protein
MKKLITILVLFSIAGCGLPQGTPQEELLGNAELSQKMEANQKIQDTYKLENAAFIKEAKDENSIQVEVGDKTKQVFEPRMKISRWEDEVSLIIGIPDKTKLVAEPRLGSDNSSELVLNEEKIEYKEADIEYHYYDIEPNEDYPEGAFEYEIVLKNKPLTNVIEMTIETSGLDFFYQPELTKEEKAEGADRPENVIDSYAVYHSTKAGHKIGDKNYKSGKAFHIYRPKIIDADKNEVWGELHIDTDKNLLTVTVPQDFLDKAVYPVVVDPTFGYTSQGGSFAPLSRDQAFSDQALPHATKGVLTENGDISKLTAYIDHNQTGKIQGGIYEYSTTEGVSIVTGGKTNELSVSSDGWKDVTYASSLSLVAETYWLLIKGECFNVNPYSTALSLAYDSGDSGDGLRGQTDFETGMNIYNGLWLNEVSSGESPEDYMFNEARLHSLYATYTASAAPATTPTTPANLIFFE